MEGIPGTQGDCHDAEQGVFLISFGFGNHQDTDGDDRNQIDDVERSFHNSLHKRHFLSYFKIGGEPVSF